MALNNAKKKPDQEKLKILVFLSTFKQMEQEQKNIRSNKELLQKTIN